MLQKKVCILGAFAVGKTSLVSRFVHRMFSEKYHTTVGVKVDKKTVETKGEKLNLVLWDLRGEDEFQSINTSYLRGSSGYLLVADGTRRATLDTAFALQQRVAETLGPLPFVLVLNKADLKADWEVEEGDLADLIEQEWILVETSAKTGAGVEEAFGELAQKMAP